MNKTMDRTEAGDIRFDEQGLIPAVVQDWRDGTVLMLGFMNRDALNHTLKTKHVHFWSRSRRTLWKKGETSGHSLLLKEVFLDCDGDTLLVKAEPVGPTCHTGEPSCFFTRIEADGALARRTSADARGDCLSGSMRRSLSGSTLLSRIRMSRRCLKAAWTDS